MVFRPKKEIIQEIEQLIQLIKIINFYTTSKEYLKKTNLIKNNFKDIPLDIKNNHNIQLSKI